MPLSQPGEREPIHTRTVTCRGWRRNDGLWDIEGHIVDVKAYPFEIEWRGRIEPGVPLHEMWARVTLDDTLTIRAIEASTDHSPYSICADAAPAMQRLVGLTIQAGFTAACKARLGGPKGCTHLLELMGPIATTAYQTIMPILWRARAGAASSGEGPRMGKIDSCFAYRSDGDLVRRKWPENYTGLAVASGDGSEPDRK